MLMKLTPGVDFTNILQTAFPPSQDRKSAKNTVKASVLFALLGSARVQDVCKMLVKSTPDFNEQ